MALREVSKGVVQKQNITRMKYLHTSNQLHPPINIVTEHKHIFLRTDHTDGCGIVGSLLR